MSDNLDFRQNAKKSQISDLLQNDEFYKGTAYLIVVCHAVKPCFSG